MLVLYSDSGEWLASDFISQPQSTGMSVGLRLAVMGS